jgi:hypothetical protein
LLFLAFSLTSIHPIVEIFSTRRVITLFVFPLAHHWRTLTKVVSIFFEVTGYLCFLITITFIGLDAIERVLKRAKTTGMQDFGQG